MTLTRKNIYDLPDGPMRRTLIAQMDTPLPEAPAPSHRRRAGGIKAVRRGRSLESAILASCGRDLLLIKIPNGVRHLRGGKTIPTKAPVDFLGVHRPSRRAVAIDAKSCALKGGFPVGNPSHVKPHQLRQLVAMGEAGAVAGLLIEATRHGRYHWCGWEMLRNPPASYQWGELVDLGPSTHAVRWGAVMEVTA